MSDVFQMTLQNRLPSDMHKLNLEIRKTNQIQFTDEGVDESFGPKIWNSLPQHIKSAEILITL